MLDTSLSVGTVLTTKLYIPNSKVHEANMGPICGRQDPGGPMNHAIWDVSQCFYKKKNSSY